jgi:hypothetical protein
MSEPPSSTLLRLHSGRSATHTVFAPPPRMILSCPTSLCLEIRQTLHHHELTQCSAPAPGFPAISGRP